MVPGSRLISSGRGFFGILKTLPNPSDFHRIITYLIYLSQPERKLAHPSHGTGTRIPNFLKIAVLAS